MAQIHCAGTVLGLRFLSPSRLALVLANTVELHDVREPESRFALASFDNPAGLFACTPQRREPLVAFPFDDATHVRIQVLTDRELSGLATPSASAEAADSVFATGSQAADAAPELVSVQPIDVQAVTTRLACIALSPDGRLLATASSDGTIYRVWNTADGKCVDKLRRGTSPAVVTAMAFATDGCAIAVLTDHASLHLWHLAAVPSTHAADGQAPGWWAYLLESMRALVTEGRYDSARLALPRGVSAAARLAFDPNDCRVLRVIAESGAWLQLRLADGVLQVERRVDWLVADEATQL